LDPSTRQSPGSKAESQTKAPGPALHEPTPFRKLVLIHLVPGAEQPLLQFVDVPSFTTTQQSTLP
jgi:hypothetical protein